MMKKLVQYISMLILLFTDIQGFSQSQEYLMNMKKADSLRRKGSYEESLLYYKKILMSEDVRRIDLYRISTIYCQLNRPDSSYKYLKKALEEKLFYRSIELFYADSAISCLKQSDMWDSIAAKVKENIAFNNDSSSYLTEIRQELLKRKSKDQEYRTKMNLCHKEFGRYSKQCDSLWNLQEKTDLENQMWLKTILDKYAWPGYKEVGKDGDHAAWLIVQHADNDTSFQKKSIHAMKQAFKNYNTNPSNLAYLIDRIRVNEGKKQLYGTQFSLEYKGGKTEDLIFKPIEDSSLVNQRRAYFGLPTIERYKEKALEHYK